MTANRIREIIIYAIGEGFAPYREICRDKGIYIIHHDGRIDLGCSYETHRETGKPDYVYNLFLDNEYISVNHDEYISEHNDRTIRMIAEAIAKEWNLLLEGAEYYV